MTILDRINLHVPLAKAGEVNAILLGKLECAAYIAAFEMLYNIHLTLDDLLTCRHAFKGMTLIPVVIPSMFAAAHILTEEQDEAVRV